jgi:hypothetical protein
VVYLGLGGLIGRVALTPLDFCMERFFMAIFLVPSMCASRGYVRVTASEREAPSL